jgi:hypothetical protein
VAKETNNTTANGRKKGIYCPYCRESGRIRRSHRRNIFERVTSFLGRFPYRCGECGNRFMLWWRGPGRD